MLITKVEQLDMSMHNVECTVHTVKGSVKGLIVFCSTENRYYLLTDSKELDGHYGGKFSKCGYKYSWVLNIHDFKFVIDVPDKITIFKLNEEISVLIINGNICSIVYNSNVFYFDEHKLSITKIKKIIESKGKAYYQLFGYESYLLPYRNRNQIKIGCQYISVDKIKELLGMTGEIISDKPLRDSKGRFVKR